MRPENILEEVESAGDISEAINYLENRDSSLQETLKDTSSGRIKKTTYEVYGEEEIIVTLYNGEDFRVETQTPEQFYTF